MNEYQPSWLLFSSFDRGAKKINEIKLTNTVDQ